MFKFWIIYIVLSNFLWLFNLHRFIPIKVDIIKKWKCKNFFFLFKHVVMDAWSKIIFFWKSLAKLYNYFKRQYTLHDSRYMHWYNCVYIASLYQIFWKWLKILEKYYATVYLSRNRFFTVMFEILIARDFKSDILI